MRARCVVPALLALCVLAPAAASQSVSAQHLHQSCRSFVADAHSPAAGDCALYLQGALDGIAASSGARSAGDASWSDRAARTRLGPRLRTLEDLRVEPQCPAPTLAQAAAEFVRYMDEQRLPPAATAGEVVAAVLGGELPCASE